MDESNPEEVAATKIQKKFRVNIYIEEDQHL